MDCPICLQELSPSIFTNTACGHAWCKSCHQKLIKHAHTTCPLCRCDIHLKRRPKVNDYTQWLMDGGVPVIRWRAKRKDKYFRKYYNIYDFSVV